MKNRFDIHIFVIFLWLKTKLITLNMEIKRVGENIGLRVNMEKQRI